jgi:hypothetical protein
VVPGERDELHAEEPELAPIAAERVRRILAAAEETAAGIVADARAEADRIRAEARTESDEKVEAASREATGRIEQARGAVEGLVAQADRLRAQVGALGRDLAANVPRAPGREPPVADSEEPAAAATVAPEEPAGPQGGDSVEQPVAVPVSGDPVAGEDDARPAGPSADQGAIRLVAMNMALEGVAREEIAQQIEADFGHVAGVDSLLDDVLARADR